MELITFQVSRNTRYNHLIFLEEVNPKSYAASVLLKEYLRSLEDPGDWQTDWRYYFIVRRLWLRKQKREHGKWTCHYCGKEIHHMPERNKKCQNLHKCVTVDHKVPKSEGIDILDTKNFLVACYDCNTRKKSTPYEIFMKGIIWARERKKKIRPSNPEIFKKVA
jgi:5-methylcytosine-specific restriction endonuclease McrA